MVISCRRALSGSRVSYRRHFSPSASIKFPGFATLPANARFFISVSGQSNALGTDAQNALTTAQAYDGLRQPGQPSGNNATAIALTEANIAPNFGESCAAALANMIHELDSTGRQCIVHNWGVGSTAYSGLARGTGNYTFGQTGTTNARNYIVANRTAETFYPIALAWIHGETDEGNGVTAAQYQAFMNTLQSDFQSDVQTIAGTTARIPLFLYQHASSAQLNPANNHEETAIGSWLAPLSNSNIYLVCPAYAFAYVAANPHLTNASNRRLGRYYGRAIKRVIVDGANWRALQPSAISATNNQVVLDFVGGDEISALVLDTTNVVQRGHTYGFDYSDGQSDIPCITGVALTGSRQVTLTLNRNAQSPARITYGNYSAVPFSLGASIPLAAGGNLRDQDTTPTGDGDRALENWCAIFDQSVGSVSGSASSTTAFSNVNSLDSTGVANNLGSARALATLNGATNCSWEFYFRSNAATWPNNNDLIGRAGSGQRMFEFRTATGGLLRFFLSTTLSDASNFYETSGWAAQTWYHCVVVKSGATIAVYRNGVLLVGTQTGVVPATLTSPISDFELLNGNNSAPANFNIAHVSLYTRALSALDVTERYNLGTPIDPRVLSTGAPAHYWPLQTNGEDLGTTATRNLFLYGALTFEAIHP